MLLNDEISIKITNKNFEHYKELGYQFNNYDVIKVNARHLTNGSHSIVRVSCDYCGEILDIPFKRYKNYTKICDKYSCSKIECSNKKIKDVCLIKYGVENPFQLNSVKEKTKKTLIEKYGVDHQMKLEKTKDKIKKTCLERYGVDNYTKTKEFTTKFKKTCLERYGFEHENQNEHQKNKRKATRIKNGIQLPDNMIEPFLLYRRRIDNISDKLKNKLLEKWDGYDFYDNEYIKDNFNLKPTNKNYPTLDHKISVLYGFLNNIPIEKIAEIDNLCITKMFINCRKNSKNEINL